METWSWPSGAPRIAAAANAAVTPGTPTTSMSSDASASAGEAIAYTPASPLPISATACPLRASATAVRARSSSAPSPDSRTTVPGRSRSRIWSTYWSSPTSTAARRSSAFARGVTRSRAPGPSPTTASRPRATRRTTAQVAMAGWPSARSDFRFGTRSSPPPTSAAASATDGVPTAARGASEGLGTSTAANSSAQYVTSGTPRRRAASTMPGSSDLASTVASWARDARDSPASRTALSTSPSTSSTGAPLDAPTPTTRDGGRSTTSRSAGSTARSVTRMT